MENGGEPGRAAEEAAGRGRAACRATGTEERPELGWAPGGATPGPLVELLQGPW